MLFLLLQERSECDLKAGYNWTHTLLVYGAPKAQQTELKLCGATCHIKKANHLWARNISCNNCLHGRRILRVQKWSINFKSDIWWPYNPREWYCSINFKLDIQWPHNPCERHTEQSQLLQWTLPVMSEIFQHMQKNLTLLAEEWRSKSRSQQVVRLLAGLARKLHWTFSIQPN